MTSSPLPFPDTGLVRYALSLNNITFHFIFGIVYSDVPVYICNQIKFGYLLSPLDETMTIEDDYAQLTNIMLEASGK
jgi:hypothetical protein